LTRDHIRNKAKQSAGHPNTTTINAEPGAHGRVIASHVRMAQGRALVGFVLASVVLSPTLGSNVLVATSRAGRSTSRSDYRASVIARARVWAETDVRKMDLMAGPGGAKAFAPTQDVTCTYSKRKLTGKTPKFECVIGDNDPVKVKYGGDNGEVYGEVLSTRLLWALGFGADHMYSVRVICRDCPSTLNGVIRSPTESIFDPTAIERKMPGEAFRPDEGWSWKELDLVDEESGGASRAEIDALKLMAVFIQHTDSKPEQQRLTCLEEPKAEHEHKAEHKPHKSKTKDQMACAHPFMLINDLGVTFGRANKFNEGKIGSVNLAEWSKTPVWQDPDACVGNLPKSATGTLDNPVISEAGRRFLADLLARLSDRQLHDLFEAARVTLRLRDPQDVFSGFPTIQEWVDAFKQKREQIVNHRCATT